MGDQEHITIKIVPSLVEVNAAQWDTCANTNAETFNPFVSHAFLKALEDSQCVGETAGWLPHHLVLETPSGGVSACMPCYVKTNSEGEFVFDHVWADAYEQAGGGYYPKLQCAVPFTPVPGPRLLVNPAVDRNDHERLLARAAVELTHHYQASSLHLTFLQKSSWQRLATLGFLQRTDQQFHWRNEGYTNFNDFLQSLNSRKRKAVRRERQKALCEGISVEHLSGQEITESHWDAFYEFYLETSARKWGRPYLNRGFFSLLSQAIPEHCLLILAKRGKRYVAGALHIIGGDCLFGRYWGAIEHYPCLHFEICYYQAIEYAIANDLARAESGAQGQHKIARGYLPTPTYSAHWIADPRLRDAIARYLVEERRQVTYAQNILADHGPFKKS